MTGNPYSPPDRTNALVTAGMLLLALLGVITVFHEPIAAIFSPAGAAGDDHASPVRPH